MPSNRGRYSHGRDKDERFMHFYNEGWQWWWLWVILIAAMLFAASCGAVGATIWTHHTNYQDVHHSYDQGYRGGIAAAKEHAVDATSTTTVPEPSPASPGSGAPAADTPTSVVAPAAPAAPAPVPFVQHTG